MMVSYYHFLFLFLIIIGNLIGCKKTQNLHEIRPPDTTRGDSTSANDRSRSRNNNSDIFDSNNPNTKTPQEDLDDLKQNYEDGINTKTFYIKEGRLFDKSGNDFVMRGINLPVAYWKDLSFGALDQIDAFGFNTVRIVWCANTLVNPGRCDPKDFYPTMELARLFDELRKRQLVAVLNLQNATGSTNPDDLTKLVDWMISDEVKTMLLANQDLLVLNIANEWFGSWNDPQNIYLNSYKTAIRRIRSAKLDHVLMIDARGWGQQFESIQQSYRELLDLDRNLIFSLHMYEVFSDPNVVAQSFQFIRDNKIPFAVGEFACEHQPGQIVACDRIMAEANHPTYPVGYIAWSYSGNGNEVQNLDIVSPIDWRTLTPWGERLLNGANGITRTAKTACFFQAGSC